MSFIDNTTRRIAAICAEITRTPSPEIFSVYSNNQNLYGQHITQLGHLLASELRLWKLYSFPDNYVEFVNFIFDRHFKKLLTSENKIDRLIFEYLLESEDLRGIFIYTVPIKNQKQFQKIIDFIIEINNDAEIIDIKTGLGFQLKNVENSENLIKYLIIFDFSEVVNLEIIEKLENLINQFFQAKLLLVSGELKLSLPAEKYTLKFNHLVNLNLFINEFSKLKS